MSIKRLVPFVTVSYLAMMSAIAAQETGGAQVYVLDPITLIAGGLENVESTGGAVVTAEDVAATRPQNLSELFARESAVNVSGGAGPSQRVYVLGIEQSKLAVSVDGVPQGVTSWHHTGSNVVDPVFLKSVEVEAGAAAADAGFAAAAGAIRYETVGAQDLLKDGQKMGGRASLAYGNNGRGVSASLAGYGVHQNMDWFVMLSGTKGDNFENGNGDEMPGTEPSARGALAKIGYEFEIHRVELAYEHGTDDADRLIKMNLDLNHDEDVYPLKVERDTISLKYTSTAPTDMWDPEIRFYGSSNRYWRPNYSVGDLLGGEGRTNGDMVLDYDTVGGVMQNSFTTAIGRITSGIDFAYEDYRIDNYGDHSSATPRVRTMETMQVGAFAQGRFEFDNGLDLSTGLRLDHHRFTDFNSVRFTDSGASVNGTLSYKVLEGVEVFAGASHTWLGYDSGEYGLLHARGANFRTDPDFAAATAKNYKLGVNASFDNWRAGMTLFDTRIDGLGDYFVAEDGSGQLENTTEARSKGVTLNAAYEWDSGRFGATYTKADVTQDGEFALPIGGTLMPLGEVATLYVDQELPDWNVTVGASAEWSGKLSDEAMAAAGFKDHNSYVVVNAYAEWQPQSYENVTLRLGVDNLFDRAYYERSSYVARSAGSRQIYPAYAPGRTVSLGLTANF